MNQLRCKDYFCIYDLENSFFHLIWNKSNNNNNNNNSNNNNNDIEYKKTNENLRKDKKDKEANLI